CKSTTTNNNLFSCFPTTKYSFTTKHGYIYLFQSLTHHLFLLYLVLCKMTLRTSCRNKRLYAKLPHYIRYNNALSSVRLFLPSHLDPSSRPPFRLFRLLGLLI